MEHYRLRKLEEKDTKEFRFISEIHEAMPAAWIDNYKADEEEVIKGVKRLIEKHRTSNILCYIAEAEGQIISFIWAEINNHNPEILDIISLWTDENHRGKGIAADLKIELEKWAKDNTKAKKINTTVSANNEAMVTLNKKLGYEINYYKMTKSI